MTPALAARDLSDSDATVRLTVSAPPRHEPPAIARCSLCPRATLDELIDAGGDVGVVHRACFAAWDQQQEALELMLAMSYAAPHHAEGLVDLDLEPVAVHVSVSSVASPSGSRRTTHGPPGGLRSLAWVAP